MESMSSSTETPKKEITEWVISKKIGDFTKTVEVRKVENGFIISKTKDGGGSDGKWMHIKKEWISDKNPLAEVEGAENLPTITNNDLFGGIENNELS